MEEEEEEEEDIKWLKPYMEKLHGRLRSKSPFIIGKIERRNSLDSRTC
jgi:hypothetical protein